MCMSYEHLRDFASGTINEQTLVEMAKLDKYDLYSEDSKKISSLLKEARKESDDKKKKAKYQEALTNAKKLRAAASKIPDDDFGDWAFNIFFKPWWWFLSDVISSVADNEGISGQSRSQALRHYDSLITKIQREIDKL